MSNTDHSHGHGAEGASPESVASGFELSDWQWRPVLILTLATFFILALAYVLIGVLVLSSGRSIGDVSHSPAATGEARLPPGPLLEQNPDVNGRALESEAIALLESYGWVDERAGTAHIPVERAMELMLEKGIEPFSAAAQAGSGGTEAPAPTAEPGVAVAFDAALAAQGEQIFTNLGCVGCHRSDNAGIGPSLEGRYGTSRPLEGGGSIDVDEAYLIESILNSTAKVAEGYQPVMPAYQAQLSNDQVAQLVEYIKSLAQ